MREQGLEGIAAKDARSLYEPGKRSGKWQKFKLNIEKAFAIGGFVPGEKSAVESPFAEVPPRKRSDTWSGGMTEEKLASAIWLSRTSSRRWRSWNGRAADS